MLKWGIYTFKAVVDKLRSDKKIWSCGDNFDNPQEDTLRLSFRQAILKKPQENV